MKKLRFWLIRKLLKSNEAQSIHIGCYTLSKMNGKDFNGYSFTQEDCKEMSGRIF